MKEVLKYWLAPTILFMLVGVGIWAWTYIGNQSHMIDQLNEQIQLLTEQNNMIGTRVEQQCSQLGFVKEEADGEDTP